MPNDVIGASSSISFFAFVWTYCKVVYVHPTSTLQTCSRIVPADVFLTPLSLFWSKRSNSQFLLVSGEAGYIGMWRNPHSNVPCLTRNEQHSQTYSFGNSSEIGYRNTFSILNVMNSIVWYIPPVRYLSYDRHAQTCHIRYPPAVSTVAVKVTANRQFFRHFPVNAIARKWMSVGLWLLAQHVRRGFTRYAKLSYTDKNQKPSILSSNFRKVLSGSTVPKTVVGWIWRAIGAEDSDTPGLVLMIFRGFEGGIMMPVFVC